MSCSPTPTATQYATITSYSPSTSYSQSGGSPQVTTVVQQSCLASTTINGSVSCISSTQITQVNTVGGGQGAQVPIVITVPVIETQPTQTLFAACTDGGSSPASQPSTSSSSNTPLTTTIVVQSTPPPSTVVVPTSATLADGSVVQSAVTFVTTLPPTSVYLATSVNDPSSTPSLQNNNSASQASGTNVAPIVGGVLGGLLGLIAIVGSLWWLCRKRRSWDDVFDKEEIQNENAWQPPTRRGRDRLGSNTEPRPYQYGLVGRVVPPGAAGEPVRASQYGSVSDHSGTHSRHTSFSATPLLQGTHSSRPSTAGSALTAATAQTNSGPGARSPVSGSETVPRSLSMATLSNSRSLVDDQPTPALLGNWTPNADDLMVLEPLNRSGSPVPPTERRILQIANDSPPSPTETVSPQAARRASSVRSSNVFIHTDGGRIPESDPPAYSQ